MLDCQHFRNGPLLTPRVLSKSNISTLPLRLLYSHSLKINVITLILDQLIVFFTPLFMNSFHLPLFFFFCINPTKIQNIHWRSWSCGNEIQQEVSCLHHKVSRRMGTAVLVNPFRWSCLVDVWLQSCRNGEKFILSISRLSISRNLPFLFQTILKSL